MSQGVKVAIGTAAGYTEPWLYYNRLYGLLERLKEAIVAGKLVSHDLMIMGGESSYVFQFDLSADCLLKYVDRGQWMLPQMKDWTEENIKALLDVAERALRGCMSCLKLRAEILRKERAVGIIPSSVAGFGSFTREQLEETVLVTQQSIEMSPIAKTLPFCAFNGNA